MKSRAFSRHSTHYDAALPFPQEIIELIIDEISTQHSPASQHALRACSLVHSAFSAPARRHLYANINFIADSSVQARAGRLVRVYKTNPHLLEVLHSFSISIRCPPAHVERMLSEVQESQASRTLLFAILFVIGFDGGQVSLAKSVHIPRLLHMVAGAPRLAMLALRGERGHEFDWRQWNEKTQAWIGEVACNPGVARLELENLKNLPARVFEGAFRAPGTVLVRNCTFCTGADDPLFAERYRLGWPVSLGNMEVLDITETAYNKFLAALHKAVFGTELHVLPTGPVGGTPLLRFDRLTTLVISLQHPGELGGVWCVILGAAHTLTSLEILDMGFSETHHALTPIYLAHLHKLRQLKVGAHPKGYPLDARAAACLLRFVVAVLRNACTPPPDAPAPPSALKTLEVSLSTRVMRANGRNHGVKCSQAHSGIFGIDQNCWEALDGVLSVGGGKREKENFPKLNNVLVRVGMKDDDEWWLWHANDQANRGITAEMAALPDTAACGWVEVEIRPERC